MHLAFCSFLRFSSIVSNSDGGNDDTILTMTSISHLFQCFFLFVFFFTTYYCARFFFVKSYTKKGVVK